MQRESEGKGSLQRGESVSGPSLVPGNAEICVPRTWKTTSSDHRYSGVAAVREAERGGIETQRANTVKPKTTNAGRRRRGSSERRKTDPEKSKKGEANDRAGQQTGADETEARSAERQSASEETRAARGSRLNSFVKSVLGFRFLGIQNDYPPIWEIKSSKLWTFQLPINKGCPFRWSGYCNLISGPTGNSVQFDQGMLVFG